MNIMYAASFDIGSKHFAYCIASSSHDVKTLRLVDLTAGKTNSVYENLLDILISEDWSAVTDVYIEQQCSRNVVAVKLAHSVWTWFRTTLDPSHVRYVSAKKTPSTSSYAKRKRQSVEESRQLFIESNRQDLIVYLDSLDKQDDVCDAYIQLIRSRRKTIQI